MVRHNGRARRRGLRDISNQRRSGSSSSSGTKRKEAEVALAVKSRSQSTSGPRAKRHQAARSRSVPPTADAETPVTHSAMTEPQPASPAEGAPDGAALARDVAKAWEDAAELTKDPAGKLLPQLYRSMCRRELEYRCKSDYMQPFQADLNHVMRTILVDWMIEVGEEYQCGPQTIQLSVNFTDRFLSLRQIKRNKLQLVGVGAMLAASKFEEIWPPSVDDFVFIADHSYPADEVKRMERVILETLGFKLVAATPHEFGSAFMLVVKRELEQTRGSQFIRKLEIACLFLQELCMQTEIYVRRLASETAAMCLYLARRYEGLPGWTEDLEAHSGYGQAALIPMAQEVDKLLREQLAARPAHRNFRPPTGTKGFTAVFNKYERAAKKVGVKAHQMLSRKRLPSWGEVAGWGT